MAGTYRKTLVNDGYYNRGNNSRKGAAWEKRFGRRMKRREAESVKRAAIREYEAEIADAIDDGWGLCEDNDFGHFGEDWDDFNDPAHDPYDYCYENGYYDDYADYEGFYRETMDDLYYGGHHGEDSHYVSGSLTQVGFSRLETRVEEQTEDAGKNLGEILEEAIRRMKEA